MNKEYKGFIAPEITPDQYIFGAGNVGLQVVQEDGNWGPLLPIEEVQNIRDIETYNCTAFGTTNAVELLLYKLTGKRLNYSDRWVGIIAGTQAPGNDPHKVAEAIRKYGLIPEEMLPFADDIKTIDEYYSFKGADKEACYRAGREWLATYEFKHEWTFTPGQPILEQLNNMKLALKGSPQCVAVYAWASTEKDVYYKNGQENHWTTIYNIEDYMKVFDSYKPFKKDLEHNLLYCKRYSITLKTAEDPVKIGIMQQLVNALMKLVGLYKEQVDALPKPTPIVMAPPLPSPTENPLKETKIEKWAKAISKWEGDTQGTNPGNLKYSSLTASWGAKKGRKALDGGNFCIFPSYQEGMLALCNFLTLGCKDQLRAFHKARTLESFMKVYAGNPPRNYIEGVRKELGVPLETPIENFL